MMKLYYQFFRKHNHEHKHYKGGPEINDTIYKKKCTTNIDIPQNLNELIENNSNVINYRQEINTQNDILEHKLILNKTITLEELNQLINLLSNDYKDFYTGKLDFSLEYKEKNIIKNINNTINIIGNKGVINLQTKLDTKHKSYLKNINIIEYNFDDDDNEPCTIKTKIINTIPSLIIDTYDMSDEFCI